MRTPRGMIVGPVVGLALVLVLFGTTFSQARAGGSADLVVHSRLCPVGYAGDNLFADCHDTPFGISFSVSGQGSGSADAAGNATFADLTPGSYSVYPGVKVWWYANVIVYCSLDGAEGTLFVPPAFGSGADGVGWKIEIPAGFSGSVICDWYFIHECVEGADCWTPTSAASDPASGGAVTGLPNTGAGAGLDSSADLALYGLAVLSLGMAAVAMRHRATR